MRTKVKFIPILAMLGLLAALFTLMPVSAADEVVEIRDAPSDPADAEKIDWIGVGGRVTLHVTDADLNESVDVVEEAQDEDGITHTIPVGTVANENFDVRLQNAPLEGTIDDITTNLSITALIPFAIVER